MIVGGRLEGTAAEAVFATIGKSLCGHDVSSHSVTIFSSNRVALHISEGLPWCQRLRVAETDVPVESNESWIPRGIGICGPFTFSTMLARSSLASRRHVIGRFLRAKSTQVEGQAEAGGPIGEDGRHEIWREDIYDHDNEPR